MLIIIPLFAFIFGTIIGSFLNVVALRFLNQSSLTGRSHCPHCHSPLRWWQLIPIISFMYLGGRCAQCGHSISVQYPLVEFITGIIFLVAFTPLPSSLVELLQTVLSIAIACVLIVLAVIDSKSYLLPDFFIIILSVLIGLALLLAWPPVWSSVLVGALSGSGLLLLVWLLTRGKGIGLGDVKLMVPLGALLGVTGSIVVVWLSFIIGGVVGVWLLSLGRAHLKTAIPFGPFLCGSAIVVLLAPAIIDALYRLVIT